jgi:hypothetical protein
MQKPSNALFVSVLQKRSGFANLAAAAFEVQIPNMKVSGNGERDIFHPLADWVLALAKGTAECLVVVVQNALQLGKSSQRLTVTQKMLERVNISADPEPLLRAPQAQMEASLADIWVQAMPDMRSRE